MANIKRVKIPYEDMFEDTPLVMLEEFEKLDEEEIDEEEKAIDKMLDGDDEDFDKLEY
ncbi:MAG TPA: hypothetical protein VM325_08980 [Alphaproteobacteria bacterium]|nr:hypothetical protein [Alphaproteobacteria bacterium]